jgi:hypothetical protein
MKRAIVSCLVVGFLVFFSIEGSSLEPPQKADVKELMRSKLQHSQKVLEAIVTNDFDALAKHADELVLLSKKAEWKVLNNPKYELYSNDFRRNAEALIQSAKEKNTDGAALAYVDLTLCCVKCHKHVREVRMVRQPHSPLPSVSETRSESPPRGKIRNPNVEIRNKFK